MGSQRQWWWSLVVPDVSDLTTDRGAYLLRLRSILAVGVAVWAIFAIQYAAQGRMRTVAVDVVAVAATGAVLWWSTGRRSALALRVAWHVALGISVAALFVASLLSGQGQAMAVWWLALVPLAAAMQVGVAASLWWSGVIIVLLAVLHGSGRWAPIEPEFVVGGFELFAGQALFVLVAMAFGGAMRRASQAAHGDVRDARDELVALVEELDTAIVLVGADGNVRLANGRGDALVPPDMRPIRTLDGLRRHFEPRGGRLWVHRATGRELAWTVAPVRLGLERGELWVLRDVTEVRQIERSKDEFVANVSHELRTPLTSIAGTVQLLHRGAAGPMSERARDLLQISVRNCARLLSLVEELLEFQAIAGGELALNPGTAQMQDIVVAAVEASEGVARTRGVSLDPAADALELQCDPKRISQALINLLSNAIKFSEEEQTVRIVGWLTVQGRARFEVHDHGPGFEPAHAERVFDRFVQGDGSSTREEGGTGLGLAITRGIVEAHGGTIGVETEPGVGSCFWFELPEECVVQTAQRPARGSNSR